jgi:glycine/D-amino acid oxidase-like deaminating enzyme
MGRPDAVVVGAGIVGAACAVELAAAGLAVTVLDGRFAGAGATAAGMGHLVVMDDSPAQLALTAASLDLWRQLAPDLPPACEDEPRGTLWVAAEEAEMELVPAKRDLYRAHGIAAEALSAAEVAAEEPRLRPGLAGGLLVPGDRVIYPPAAARFLLALAVDRGAAIREGVAATGIGPSAVATAEGTIEAGLVVNAAGAEAPRLTPGLPIAPRKGHLAITDRYPGFCRHQLVELGYLKSAHGPDTADRADRASVAFNVQPRATGQLLVGSSRQYAGFDAAIDRSLLSRMLARAIEFLPELRGLSTLRAWTGFRPATPDKLPLIGRWEPVPGLWIAAGHEGLGITTALATGRLLADLALGRPPLIDPAPFDPGRFTSLARAGASPSPLEGGKGIERLRG